MFKKSNKYKSFFGFVEWIQYWNNKVEVLFLIFPVFTSLFTNLKIRFIRFVNDSFEFAIDHKMV